MSGFPPPLEELFVAAVWTVGHVDWRHTFTDVDGVECVAVGREQIESLYAALRDHWNLEDYEPFAGYRQDDGRETT